MNKNEYLIQYRLKTLAELIKPFSYKKFKFKNWDFSIREGLLGKSWIASKKIMADSISEAHAQFYKELNLIVGKLAFTSQCSFNMQLEPYLIFKTNNNPERIFFMFYSKETNAVGLHYDKEEIEALKRLIKFKKDTPFFYINESSRATTPHARLAMLIIALESIAGDIEKIRECSSCKKTESYPSTNYKVIDEILGENFRKEIFKSHKGIRNQLFHGKEIPNIQDNADKIYEKIVVYFVENYSCNLDKEVVHPQRNFNNNKICGQFWLKMTSKKNRPNL